MENTNKVVFRRINGRIVPIKAGVSKMPALKGRKASEDSTGISSAIEKGVISGGAGGAAVFGGFKGAESWLGQRVKDLGKKLDKFPRKAVPKKPKFTYQVDTGFGDVPLGRVAGKMKAKPAYDAAVARYAKKLTQHSDYGAKRLALRFQKLQFIKYRNLVSMNTPRAVVGAAIGVGAIAAGISLYNHYRAKK